MNWIRRHIEPRAQGGFTLLEAAIAAGLSAMILATLFYAVGEGTDISRDVAKVQDVERCLNNALLCFGDDILTAKYFYAGTESTGTGGETLDSTPKLREITFSITRSDGSIAWVKYELVTGMLTGDTYLIRLSDLVDPEELRLAYIAHDVANLEFLYYDSDGAETDNLELVSAIEMIIVIDAGLVSKERKHFFQLRNENLGLLVPPWDFDEERDSQILK